MPEFLKAKDVMRLAETHDIVLLFNQFIDDFRYVKSPGEKAALIEDEPDADKLLGGWLCNIAAAVESLAVEAGIEVPGWTQKQEYFSPVPFYSYDIKNEEFKEYFKATTPEPFARRNLFPGENVLSRC